jgi:hypothetical protein
MWGVIIMADIPESAILMISTRLREWIHDVNNALFVTKGFLEELNEDIKESRYKDPEYDHENLADMVTTVARNIEKIDQNLAKLRKFAKEEVFDNTGVSRPNP